MTSHFSGLKLLTHWGEEITLPQRATKIKDKKWITLSKECSISREWYIIKILNKDLKEWKKGLRSFKEIFVDYDAQALSIISTGFTLDEIKEIKRIKAKETNIEELLNFFKIKKRKQ